MRGGAAKLLTSTICFLSSDLSALTAALYAGSAWSRSFWQSSRIAETALAMTAVSASSLAAMPAATSACF